VIESKLDEELEEMEEGKEDPKKEDTPPVEIEGRSFKFLIKAASEKLNC